ncbi:MAG: hypothetical protein R6W97_06035 [Thiobacillus sp.]
MLEVLFAIVILSIALLATARLHAMVTQDGSYAKARGVAANLAREKLDDLKSFTVLADNPETTAVNECAAPVSCFSEIANNAGGREKADGTLTLPSGAITNAAYSYTYNRNWTVTNYYICTPGSAPATANCASPNAKPYPDFKTVTLTVDWTDEKNAAQSVVMQASIYSSDPLAQGTMVASPSGGGKPIVSYTPIGVPDAVPVPINTGGDKFKESSKPVPDVSAQATGAEVSFDAISYASNGTGGYNTTQREEFVTTACECSFNGTGTGYAPSRMVWNGAGLEAKIGDQVSKPVGTAASGQSELCTACCRDHHDVNGTTQPKYDPDRPSSGYAINGDHKHYWYSKCTSGTVGSTSGCNANDKDLSAPANGYSEVLSGAYLESCRFKRVDGIWRLWQDWREVKMTVMPYDFLQTTANLNAYVDVIEAVVENTIRTDSDNGSKDPPALDGRDVTFSAEGEVKQLLGRAIYVDRVYQAAEPTTLDSAYYSKLVGLIAASKDWLNIVPFYEANLTLLIDWGSSHPTKAEVTSEPIEDINDVSSGYYNSYSRGKVKALAAGTATIKATARLHNSGVTGGVNTSSPSYGISGYDNTAPLSDFITVTVPSSSTSVAVEGIFIRSNVSVNYSTLLIAGATCTLQTAIGNEMPYTCSVASGANVKLDYSSSASGYSFNPASQTLGIVSSKKTAGVVTVYGPTVLISGSITATNGGAKLTSVAATGGSCSIAAGGKSYSCTVPRGTSGYDGTITFVGDNPSLATYSFSKQQSDFVELHVSVTK